MDQSNTTMTDSFPRFTRALVRQVPESIREHSEAVETYKRDRYYRGYEFERIDIAKAREEHERYTQTLRDLGLEVTVLPADESTPDCPFVEDTCVVVGNRALVTRPWGGPRRRELDCVETCLKSLGLEVHRIHDEKAKLEGGDVVFTGKEFFVAASECTNKAGRKALANTFPEYPVHTIPVLWPEFHLKGVACCAGPGVMVLGKNKDGKRAWKKILEKSEFTYEPVWVPDNTAVDCIHVNGNVIHCTEKQGPKSMKVFEEKLSCFNRVPCSIGELGKVDAALSCCSVLF
ncbi:PREDICTED: N(G),N(G)-dimethylarginine dimethylaminohydrolase 1-like [Branchiostoma belcheri]|uniref:N(G),N(G)-dimethylarginine dimethylaminohydrolase 1-like n=1 Tax=Branchiostoma belcheri TaxID=7741 RepID=A0A6P4YKA9_BRABE|nr:PREDICTED: N(G),N(G)-dimethylarginine dimethylaminohydrolase 1-like [Branchiostoma belcheri]XP_019624848.1 PREDICTED: N(G),N(G)-dimethylarginine dimethylaminohydrolase 1-like [Branchiostoma belcheri]XP_019624849.1 PREDICTED: N(G),N(G)-dimethylarginine dimethylaminohydrolase 1-like [Branchiostoma belcheri]